MLGANSGFRFRVIGLYDWSCYEDLVCVCVSGGGGGGGDLIESP